MRSYMILAVLALAASTISPALTAPTRYRYGNLLVGLKTLHDNWICSRAPRRVPLDPLNVLQAFRWHDEELYRGAITPGPPDPSTRGGTGTGTGNRASPQAVHSGTINRATPENNRVARPSSGD